MAESGKRADPFLAFRFDVRFEPSAVGPKAGAGAPEGGALGGFTECTGLGLEVQVQDYLEGGCNDHAHKFPTRAVQSNVVLKRGVIDKAVWDWHHQTAQGRVQLRDVTILVYDLSGGTVVMEFRLRGAFPCKLTGPDLNAAQSGVAIETLELCHQGLERRQ